MNKTKNAGVILIKRKLRVVHFNFGPIIMFWIMCVLLLWTLLTPIAMQNVTNIFMNNKFVIVKYPI